MANSAVVGLLRALLVADTAEFDRAMKRAGESTKKWGKELQTLGREATAAGATLTAGLTLPLVAIGAGASKLAIDFESSFAGVRKTVDATEGEFKKLETQFRTLAKTIPVNVNEINKLGEAAGALGIPKESIKDFVEVMAGLGVATDLTADQAANAVARIQNIFGAAGKDTDRFASTLVALGNAGASTEKEIVEMAQRIAGAGHTVGLSQAQVLAFASTLASVGINAEAGGSAISRVFLKINAAVGSGGPELAKFAKAAQMSAADFKRAFETDAAGAVNTLIGEIGKLGKDAGPVIQGLLGKNIILTDTILRVAGAGELLTEQLGLANTAWEENKALTDETSKRYETTAAQLQILWNRLQDVGITLGQALLPALKTLMSLVEGVIPLIEGLVNAFANLPAPVKAVVIGIGLLAAAAGPVLVLLGGMATGIGSLVAAFATGGAAATAFAGTVAFLSNPITLVVGALGLLALGIYSVATAETDLEKQFRTSRAELNQHTAELDIALATYEELRDKQHRTAAETADLDAATRLLAEASGLSTEAFKAETEKSDALTTSLHGQIAAVAELNREALRQAASKREQLEKELALLEKRRRAVTEGRAMAGPSSFGGEPVIGPAETMGVTERLAETTALTARIDDLTVSWKAAKAAEDELSGATARYNQIQREGREAMAWITKTYPGVTAQTRAHAGAVGDEEAASDKAAKAAKRHAEEIAHLADTLTGKKAAAEMATLAEALALVKKTGAKLDLDKVREEIEKLQKAGAKLTPELQAIVDANVAAKAAADAHLAALRAQGEAMYRDALLVEQLTREAKELDTAIAALTSTEINQPILMPKTWAQLTTEMDRAGKEFDEIVGEMSGPRVASFGENLRAAFVGPNGLVGNIGQGLSDMFAAGITGAQKFSDGFVGVWKGIQRQLTDILSNILNVFINKFLKVALDAILGSQSGYAQAFAGLIGGGTKAGVSAGVNAATGAGGTAAGAGAGTLPGAAAGSGLGALAGPAAGAGVGYAVGNYVGYKTGSKTKGALSGAAAGASTGAIVGSVVPGFGTAVGAVVGGVVGAAAGWYGAVKAGKDINKMRDAFADSVGGMEAIEKRLASLGKHDLFAPLAFGERNIDAFKTALGNVQEVFQKADLKAANLKAGFDKLGPAVAAFGATVPASLRPMIDELLKSKDLTADMRGTLQGMSTDPSMETMRARAQELGIEFSALGSKFNEARIGEVALGYKRDIEMFADAGADMSGVIHGMSDELSALYLDAKKNGVALPESLKPYMEKLVEMGELVDENGDKVGDLNAVAFKEIEDEALVQVVDILKEIKDLLAKDLPAAARTGAEGVRNEFADKPVRIPVEYDYGGGPSRPHVEPAPEIGLWGGTHGQYVDWGPEGTAVTLHGRERVMTEEEIGGGGPITITVVSKLDGREVARNQIKYIPRELSLAGV